MARWTAVDPSGFPDGGNNWLYVNNAVADCFDAIGLNFYHINDPLAAGGFGHAGAIIGSGNKYTYHSYASQNHEPHGPGEYTEKSFNSLTDAMDFARSQGYTRYERWNTNSDMVDADARERAKTWGGQSTYDLLDHNCAGMVHDMMIAAAVEHLWRDPHPNLFYNHNIDLADQAGKVSELASPE